jgi:hypothetical protein
MMILSLTPNTHSQKPTIASALAALLVLLCGCGGGGESGGSGAPAANPPPPPPPPPLAGFTTGTTFVNSTIGSGLSHGFLLANPGSTSDPAQIGGGVAAADFDRDDDIDLYFVGGDGKPNGLYRNDGENNFTDIAKAMGLDAMHLGSGPAFADIDGDSDLDLFVGGVEGDPIYLFRNDGSGFTDVSQVAGLDVSADNTVSATFADYDLDNDLDLFLTHWGNAPEPDTENLWQNNGDGTFTSASVQSEIADQIIEESDDLSGFFDYSFAAIFSDIDGDLDPDLLISSDFRTSKVFRNNGDGTFLNITDRDVVLDRNGMGNSVGDYDNDGDMDWFVSSIKQNGDLGDPNIGNRLYRNLGDGTFEDVTEDAGVADGGWGWGSCMQDFDNDGDLDIFHVNGWEQLDPRDAGGPNDYTFDQVRYFENQGDGTFVQAAAEAGLIDTGQGRGLVCFDSDRDGDLDIVLTNNQEIKSVVFYQNELASDSHYLTVKLSTSSLNTAGIGSRIQVSSGGTVQVREIRLGNNFVSQSPAEAHFGLGDSQTVDVLVTWPDGSQTALSGVTADQLMTIDQP